MTPAQYYQLQLNEGRIKKDPQQTQVVSELQRIYLELITQNKPRSHVFGQLMQSISVKKPVKGLYVFGNVGAGKTFLIDIFYHCYPLKKLRLHFHQFMQRMHDELTRLQGRKNPIDEVAKNLSKETTVLCFDEFFVDDVVDAMILSKLLQALFKYGICLVTTSNISPDNLYKDGLQRERFLPAIHLLRDHTAIMHLHSEHDYRLEHLAKEGVYFTPLDASAEKHMEKSFRHFSNNQPDDSQPLILFDRKIIIRKQAGGVIWFDFMDLCDIPRSQKDYLELTKNYHTILISNIPAITSDQNNLITAFINLIDVLYDAGTQLVVSAETDIDSLYLEGRMKNTFKRITSRLKEMQSRFYMEKR